LIEWLEDARTDLWVLGEYIAAANPRAAHDLRLVIVKAIGQLAHYPYLGRVGRVPGTRELVIPRTKHIVAYRVQAGRIEILRILHGARRWPERF
jgi:toxin ParE1/3/4